MAQTAAWLRSLSSWTELLGHATEDERRTIYRETIARATLDAAAGAITVAWTPAIVRLCGAEACTVPLGAQPRLPATTIALIRALAQAEPRPTAQGVQE